MATSSSAKKVAKLASRGKGKKVRFQGGTVFPAVVLVLVVLLLALIVYARQSRPSDGAGSPKVGEHWHAAYGMKVCDVTLPKLAGDLEGTDAFNLIGVHSHGDGVIHYHPYSSKSTGNRAKLGVFLNIYDVDLTDSALKLPAAQGGEEFSIKDGKLVVKQNGKEIDLATSEYAACAGKDDMVLKVRVWKNFSDTGAFQDYVTEFDGIRIRNDGMVFEIALVRKDAAITQPDWAAELPSLGAADGGNVPTTTISGATTTVAGTTPGTSADTTPGTVADTTPGTGTTPEVTSTTSG